MFILNSVATGSSFADAFLAPPPTNHHGHQQHVRRRHQRRTRRRSISQSSEDSPSKESSDLLERAQKLREEALRLEQNLRENRPSTNRKNDAAPDAAKPAAAPTELEDSTWTFSYRFSSQPKEDEDADEIILPNYSGKLTIRLTPDGYSEVVSNEENQLRIGKVWGWDEEYSREDQKKYLLFSMDVQFPKTDPLMSERIERCYLQARVDRDPIDGTIALNEGTVTVKKDISNKTRGMWGIFQVSGILTQFRYVGDFSSKAAAAAASSSQDS